MHDPVALTDAVRRRAILPFAVSAFAWAHPGQRLNAREYFQAMCYQIQRVINGENRRLIIAVPPRHGKSELASVALPAFLLGQDPATKVMVASYGQALTRQHADATRTLMRDPRYQQLFPGTVIQRGQDTADVFKTSRGGERRSVSVGGAVTGLGAHWLIIDDLQKADEALTETGREAAWTFYRNSLLSRFDNPADARIIVVQQRLHEDDLLGRLREVGGWHYLSLPAIAEMDSEVPLGGGRLWSRRTGELLDPVRVPREELEQKRREQGPRFFNAQYQQNPVAGEGSLINLGWFGQYDEAPPRHAFQRVVQSWDTASTDRINSDYSVGLTWGWRDDHWYLLDVIRQRLRFVDLKDRVLAWHRHWKADALVIEQSSAGHGLIDEVERAKLPGLLRCPKPTTSKLDRVAAQTGQLATGMFLLPRSAEWLPDLRHELVAFPDARNDDQVDALIQFVAFATDNERWVRTQYDSSGRRLRAPRPERRSSYYDGDAPSQLSR